MSIHRSSGPMGPQALARCRPYVLTGLWLCLGVTPARGAIDNAGETARLARLEREAQAMGATIQAAGGYQAIADRLAPWRQAVAARLASKRPPLAGKAYIADDWPLDGGDGWILSGRRARQLLYESDFSALHAKGDRRYALAESALTKTHHELASLGIRFLVVPAPDTSDVYPERIAPLPEGVPTVNLKSRQLFMRLLRAGVEVLDVEPLLRSIKDDESPPYLLRDTHWSPAGARAVAAVVAARLAEWRRPGEIREHAPREFAWEGDLARNWAAAGRPAFPKETHRFVPVGWPDGRALSADPEAPILLLGDSYTTFPYCGRLSFWAFLSHGMGYPVAFIDHAGGGNAVVAKFRNLSPARRASVRAVVLLFTHCALYESDFPTLTLLDAPLPLPPVRQARVTLEEDCPPLDPARAAYADAVAGLRASVDRGDGAPIAMQVYVPIMRKRVLLPAARWKRQDIHRLDLFPSEPAGQAGVMLIEAQPDPALPAGYVHLETSPAPASDAP